MRTIRPLILGTEKEKAKQLTLRHSRAAEKHQSSTEAFENLILRNSWSRTYLYLKLALKWCLEEVLYNNVMYCKFTQNLNWKSYFQHSANITASLLSAFPPVSTFTATDSPLCCFRNIFQLSSQWSIWYFSKKSFSDSERTVLSVQTLCPTTLCIKALIMNIESVGLSQSVCVADQAFLT